MAETLKQRVIFLIAIVFATIAGSVGTAVVMAAIPNSSSAISGCYDNKGNLRVIDTEAGKTCKNQETVLNWGASTGGSQVQFAYAGLNEDDTVDTNYTRNVLDYKIVPGGGTPTTGPDNEFYLETACFKIAFEPRHTTATSQTKGPLTEPGYAAGFSDEIADYIESICGEGFNAAWPKVAGMPLERSDFKFIFHN